MLLHIAKTYQSLCALCATGEAMVAAQALSLLAWDAMATFLLNPTKPALVDHQGALRPEAVGLFVEGLLVRSCPNRKQEAGSRPPYSIIW